MKLFKHAVAIAGLAAATFTAAPALAQIEGKVATSSISNAILSVPSFQTALNQVGTTYAAQIQQIQTKQGQLSELIKPFDTNGNNTIDQAEQPALQQSASFAQVQTLQREINGIENQITAAQVYATEQVLAQYQTALNEVAAAQQIVMVVDPASLQFAGEGADITAAVGTQLATKVSVVGIVPPQGYQPTQTGAQIFGDIQRRLLIREARARAAAQQQQQQQGNTEAPAGR